MILLGFFVFEFNSKLWRIALSSLSSENDDVKAKKSSSEDVLVNNSLINLELFEFFRRRGQL